MCVFSLSAFDRDIYLCRPESSSSLDSFLKAHIVVQPSSLTSPSLSLQRHFCQFTRQSLSRRIKFFPFISIFAYTYFHYLFFFVFRTRFAVELLYSFALFTQCYIHKQREQSTSMHIPRSLCVCCVSCVLCGVLLYAHYDDTRRRLLNKVHCTHASPWPLRTLSRLVVGEYIVIWVNECIGHLCVQKLTELNDMINKYMRYTLLLLSYSRHDNYSFRKSV